LGTVDRPLTPMPSLDVVILVVYLFTLIYVAYRAINNMEDRAAVAMDQGALNAQLEEQGLKEAIAIKIPLKGQYGFEPISDLALTIANLSQVPFYVDWDRSTLTNFAGRSRRVIRVTPTLNLDLSQPQVFSVVGPGQALSERVVAEDMLKAKAEGGVQIAAPLVDLGPVSALPEGKQLEFALRLVLRRVTDTTPRFDDSLVTHALTCRFMVRRIPWDENFPWKKKAGDK